MKKYIALILVAFLLMGGVAFAEQYQDRLDSPGYRVSAGTGEAYTKAYPWEPVRKFQLVRYVGSGFLTEAPLSAGSMVVWHTGATTNDGVTVTTTTLSQDSRVAGVVTRVCLTRDAGQVNNTSIQDYGRRNWSWLQTYGPTEANISAGPLSYITAGAAIATGSTVGTASNFDPLGPGSGACGMAGFALTENDGATAGTRYFKAFLKCE